MLVLYNYRYTVFIYYKRESILTFRLPFEGSWNTAWKRLKIGPLAALIIRARCCMSAGGADGAGPSGLVQVRDGVLLRHCAHGSDLLDGPPLHAAVGREAGGRHEAWI